MDVPAIPAKMEPAVLITMVAVAMSAFVLLALRDQTVKMVHINIKIIISVFSSHSFMNHCHNYI